MAFASKAAEKIAAGFAAIGIAAAAAYAVEEVKDVAAFALRFAGGSVVYR